jgi:transglutaminase-like putative cysteine protease
MDEFLRSTDVIDWQHPAVRAKAEALRAGLADVEAIARRCFEWVRDEIRHSTDFGLVVVTCAASDVLEQGSGYCYAKSHLLAAMLRANGIPAGFCYQRLSLDDNGRRFCLHGFNGVQLPGVGWYRADPRGNRAGIDAQFVPPVERLAFQATVPGEIDSLEIWSDPIPVVVEALRAHSNAGVLAQHLPDVLLDGLAGSGVRRSPAPQ